MFKKYKISNFTGRINAFRVIKRLQILNILGGQNTESVKIITQVDAISTNKHYVLGNNFS